MMRIAGLLLTLMLSLVILHSSLGFVSICGAGWSSSTTRYYQEQQQQQQQQCLSAKSTSNITSSAITIEGIECVPLHIHLPQIGDVIVVEATASSQETLVDWALLQDEDDGELSFASARLPSGDPYGAVLWPASSAIAASLLQSEDLRGKRVLEVGAGTGLVSIAASLAGAGFVLATDYEEIPLKLLRYAAKNNGVDSVIETAHFDLCGKEPLPEADILVAADIMYEPATGIAMAARAVEGLRAGMKVWIGDSPGRAGRPAFLQELRRLGVFSAAFVDVVGSTVTGKRHDLICGKGSTSVSEHPQPLTIAIMELDPSSNLPPSK